MVYSSNVPKYDLVIIGTGIVGLATAQEISQRYPSLKYCVVDKEPKIGEVLSFH